MVCQDKSVLGMSKATLGERWVSVITCYRLQVDPGPRIGEELNQESGGKTPAGGMGM